MARTYHFRRHLVEARRNRLRLVVAIALIVVATSLYTVPSIITLAATAATADLDGAKILSTVGGTYGGPTNGVFSTANVTVTRVSSGVAVNSVANPFSFTGLNAITAGDHYLVSVPASGSGAFAVKGLTWCEDACAGFDPQSTNFQSGSAIGMTLYPNHFYHIRFIYSPSGSGAPAPAATPVPTGVSGSVVTPTNFQALVAGDNALVVLSWAAPVAAVGATSYLVERSIDNINWTVVTDGITALTLRDDTVTFGVHYYYRLRSKDAAGNSSGYAYAEASTVSFSPNSASSSSGTYVSDDQLARVDIPAGALTDNADCSVTTSGGTTSLSSQTLVAGPYSLVCKDQSAAVAGDFNMPVTWHIALGTKLKGLGNPTAMSVGTTGLLTGIDGATLDSNTNIITFNQLSASTVAVYASPVQGLDPSIFATLVVLAAIVAGVIVVVLRNAQKAKYHEYIRKKYYDI